jgi:hypothetical protein
MTAIEFNLIELLTGGKLGVHDTPCPICGPTKRGASARRRVLRIWRDGPDFASYHCPRCPMSGYARGDFVGHVFDRAKIERQKAEAARRDQDYAAQQLGKARYLWRTARPAAGTPAESYLRSRGIDCPPPATIRFLESRKAEHHPAMICPFGLAQEPEPGLLAIDESSISGVHLTLLRPDGLGKADVEPNKIMVGSSLGAPIVLVPMNDLLGLAITEGIEDALSAHVTSGLGAWAAGSADRLPALADVVPDFADCINIAVDDNEAGRRGAQKLARPLSERGLFVEFINLSAEIGYAH